MSEDADTRFFVCRWRADWGGWCPHPGDDVVAPGVATSSPDEIQGETIHENRKAAENPEPRTDAAPRYRPDYLGAGAALGYPGVMTTEREEDPLSWAGGEADPTLVEGAATAPAVKVPAAGTEVAPGWHVVGAASGQSAPVTGSTQMSSPLLLLHGVLGGVYLLYMIGWLASRSRFDYFGLDPLMNAMTVAGQTLAILAPALWFGATLWLTRASTSLRWRIIWLLIGAIILAPIPFIMGVRS